MKCPILLRCPVNQIGDLLSRFAATLPTSSWIGQQTVMTKFAVVHIMSGDYDMP